MQRPLLTILRWAVFALACWFLMRQWREYESNQVFRWLPGQGHMDTNWALYLGLVLVGVPMNWGVETWKWRVMLGDRAPSSFLRSFGAVLAGCGISLITPNRTGEFLGRVLFIDPADRIPASILTVLASLSQLLATLLVGTLCCAIWWLVGWPTPFASAWDAGSLVLAAAMLSMAAWSVFSHPAWLRRQLLRWPFLQRWRSHLDALALLRPDQVWTVQALSLVRYAIFMVQFALLLIAFGARVPPAATLVAVPVIFLLTTLAPTVMFTELGVRAGAALFVLGALGADDLSVVLASSVLWSVNVLLPAVVGSIVLLVVRIRTTQAAT